jgi:hypothetical protein
VFAIVNRYYERPAQLPPLTIEGKPNYNMGPVKFATVAAVFWGGRSVFCLTAQRLRHRPFLICIKADIAAPHHARSNRDACLKCPAAVHRG